MVITNQSKLPLKLAISRALSIAVGYMIIATTIYLICHVGYHMCMKTMANEDNSPLPQCFTQAGEKASSVAESTTGRLCDKPSESIDDDSNSLEHVKHRYAHSIILAIIAAILYVPQLYGAVKLIHATKLCVLPDVSVKLAFTHQQIQIVVLCVELGLTLIHLDRLKAAEYNMIGKLLGFLIFKMIAFLIVEAYIHQQLQIISNYNCMILLLTSPNGQPLKLSKDLFSGWNGEPMQYTTPKNVVTQDVIIA